MNAENYKAVHEKFGDVLFVEITPVPDGVVIDTMEIGDRVGFPGQVVVRFNEATRELYGIEIERYSAVERKLKRDKAIHNAKLALAQLLQRIMEALQNARPAVDSQLQPV